MSSKKIALLHDICGVGKAALMNMIPVLSVLGYEACPVPTMLLSTHTGGFNQPVVYPVPPQFVKDCADHYVQEQILFDAIFVGYLGTPDMLQAVLYFLSKFPGVPVIFDPIMGDHGNYYKNFGEDYKEALLELIPYADILLPNFTEFCLLWDMTYTDSYTEAVFLNKIKRLPLKENARMIITSIPGNKRKKNILLYADRRIENIELDGIDAQYHGSGDVFDAVFLGSFLKECDLKASILTAHKFVYNCITVSCEAGIPKREGLRIENCLTQLV